MLPRQEGQKLLPAPQKKTSGEDCISGLDFCKRGKSQEGLLEVEYPAQQVDIANYMFNQMKRHSKRLKIAPPTISGEGNEKRVVRIEEQGFCLKAKTWYHQDGKEGSKREASAQLKKRFKFGLLGIILTEGGGGIRGKGGKKGQSGIFLSANGVDILVLQNTLFEK